MPRRPEVVVLGDPDAFIEKIRLRLSGAGNVWQNVHCEPVGTPKAKTLAGARV
jgi:hypothetical protein